MQVKLLTKREAVKFKYLYRSAEGRLSFSFFTMRILQFTWWGMLCLMLLAACQRELYFDNNPEPVSAQFSFIATNDSCSNPLIMGSYQQGVALLDSNKISLELEVTRTGTYRVQTLENNQVYFRDSGNFTSVGRQRITLKGYGTPASAGRFLFSGAGCSFSVDFSGNTSVSAAIFNLGGAPGDCTGFTVSGNFTAGNPLDSATHGISLQVFVSRTGTYTIASDEVNGIRFSASGVFSSTGLQTIRLAGSGTPLSAGDFMYRAGNNPGACGFSINVMAAGPAAATSLICTETSVAGTYQQGSPLTGANTILVPVSVSSAGNYSIVTPYINGCVFSAAGFLPSGDQVIILTGNGIPPDSGSFRFPVKLGDDSCSVLIRFSEGIFNDYLVCNIDGTEQRFDADLMADDANIFPGLNSISIVGRPSPGAAEYFSITLNSIQPIGPGFFSLGAAGKFSGSFHKDVGNVFWQPADQSNPRFVVTVNSVTTTRVEGTFIGQYFDLNGLGSNSRQITQGRFSVRIQ